jgi:two-component system KDP operon response regulator KdpE
MNAHSPRILVIEDEAQIRRFVRMALEASDYAVSEAALLHQGMIQAGTHHPDLIILDLNLPDGDGIELVKAVRTWSDVPLSLIHI